MYSLKVISISATGKSAYVSVSKKTGPFVSEIAVGNLKLADAAEAPEVGSIIPLDSTTKVSTRIQTDEEGKEFNWVVLD